MTARVTAAPIVVVGGGTAGCTVAAHLAARTSSDVILIEPGRISAMDDARGFFDVLGQDGITRSHEVTTVRGGPTRSYLEGRALGGGSAVNGMILSGEVPAELEGLTRTARPDDIGEIGGALLAAGGEPVRLWWNGGRWNPGRAVDHLVEEGRIVRMPGEATSLRVDDGVVGVRVGDDEIVASQVVMCAGALATPRILLASNLDRVDPSIGRGLQTHPMISFALHRSDAVPFGRDRFDAAVVKRGATTDGRATLTVAYERASRSDPHLGLLSVMLMDVESRGSVEVVDGRLRVDFNCLDTPGDRRSMIGATRGLLACALSPAMAGVTVSISVDDAGTPVEVLGGMGEADLERWVLDHAEPASHASSSCAAAVDSSGRLRGVPNVWVADASVLGRVPSCTPAGPVTMEARRIARCVEGVVTGTTA